MEKLVSEQQPNVNRDFIQQSGDGHMPVHSGSGDLNIYNIAPTSSTQHMRQVRRGRGFWRSLVVDGRWYFLITIASAGTLACVPFFHAAAQLKRRLLYLYASSFAVVGLVIIGLVSVAPSRDEAESDPLRSTVGGIELIVIVVACFLLVRLRDQTYPKNQRTKSDR